jgi:hypothetical protein
MEREAAEANRERKHQTSETEYRKQWARTQAYVCLAEFMSSNGSARFQASRKALKADAIRWARISECHETRRRISDGLGFESFREALETLDEKRASQRGGAERYSG